MKLLFKQRFFSWLDSYDIFDENGNTVYTAKGELSFGHQLRIYDSVGTPIALVKQKMLTFMPRFELYVKDQYLGCISREFSLFTPRYNIDFNGWHVEGNWMEWDYTIIDTSGNCVATITKEIWNWTDTYTIDIPDSQSALGALMLVLAIDAEKCSRNS